MGVATPDDAVPGHFLLDPPLALPSSEQPAGAINMQHSTMQPSDGTTSSTMRQLPAAHLPLLQSIMQRELQALSPTSRQLQLARCILQQQHSTRQVAWQEQAQGQHKRVEVVPLLGMCLLHLVSSDHRAQHDSSSAVGSPRTAAAEGRVTPAELCASMAQVSPFLNVLQSELRSLHTVSGSCYSYIKQQLAAVGQLLPPAADDSGRRSSVGSNRDPDGGSTGLESRNSSNSSSYYGKGLDLQQLHSVADAAALDLVCIEDCISSNVTSLAQLVQQYDVLITAALAAADDPAAGAPDGPAQQPQHGAPAAANGRKGGFLAHMLDAVRGKGGSAANMQPAAVEYVFMTNGVCSHSSSKEHVRGFCAGVAADVYSSCIHKLLSRSSCAERVLWMLSVIYARLRYAADAVAAAGAASGMQGAGSVKQWNAPDKFTRSTTKYWVHPSNILRLKLALTKQLPLLVYGADDPVSSGDVTAVAAEGADGAEGTPASQHKVTSLVSSVYFDNPQLDVYHTRLARLDGAKLARIRYYGQRLTGEAGAEQTMFVEQKTHRDKLADERSFKERASLHQSQVPAFLSGQVPLEQLVGPNSKKLELLSQIQEFLADQDPVMRSEYLRSAWQAYDDNAVRFSLDEHMLLLRESPPAAAAGSTGSSSSNWCCPLESLEHIPASDAVKFPYAILEIKLRDRETAPAWVHELQTSGLLVEVPKFSKFIHGMILLHPERIREVPSWFVWREGEGVSLPATLDEVWDMRAERRAQKELEWQDRQDTSTAAAIATPDVAAMLALLRAPRTYASTTTAINPLIDPADAASKLVLASVPSYELTATAASTAAAVPAPPMHQAPSGAGLPLGIPSSRRNDALATDSTNSHDSTSTGWQALVLHGPAHSIMQDGQFGCAGADGSSANRGGSGGGYRGAGGGMQPLLGLMLPGRRDSWSCSRAPGTHMDTTVESPAIGSPDALAQVNGCSPSFTNHPLTVRMPSPHNRSLSSSSMASSDLHATNSSSSIGAGAAETALPHFTACSASPACSHSPVHPGYPAIHHDHNDPTHTYGVPLQDTARAAGTRRSNSRAGSSSGGSWTLTTANPLFPPGPLGRTSLLSAPPVEQDSCRPHNRDSKDAGFGGADTNGSTRWWGGSEEGPGAKKPAARSSEQDIAPLGPKKGGDVVLDFSKLAAQAAAPLTAAAVAAGAGSRQIIQVHYTGAVEAVPVAAAPAAPSPRQVRELARLLPPAGTDAVGTAAVLAAAADAAELGTKPEECQGVDAVAVTADGGAAGKGKGSSRGYRQRMQQWRAALGGRMKGIKKGKGTGGGAINMVSVSSTNDHMLGFGGAAPRQPSYVKPRVDPKTFFANERTFLQWLQISVLVMMTGLGMLTGSTVATNGGGSCMSNALCGASRISGAIIAPVSVLFMIYAIYLYHKRTKQLLMRSTLRYDDARGPWLLTILLILVTLLVIVLALEGFRAASKT